MRFFSCEVPFGRVAPPSENFFPPSQEGFLLFNEGMFFSVLRIVKFFCFFCLFEFKRCEVIPVLRRVFYVVFKVS